MFRKNMRAAALANWRFFFIILAPLILSPLLFLDDTMEINGKVENTTKFRCLYVLLLMASYWMAEAIPIPITALLPVVLLPFFGVVNTATVSSSYMNDGNMMVIGGFVIAHALESNNIHTRVAMFIMVKIGSSPARMLTSIMVATFFISMWLETVATVALMVPVVMAILEGVETKPGRKMSAASSKSNNQITEPESPSAAELNLTIIDEAGNESLSSNKAEIASSKNQKQMFLFSILYTSILGGISVVTGAVPNVVAFQHLKTEDLNQNGKHLELTFATWIAYNFPIMLINGVIVWAYLILKFLGSPDWMAFWRKNKKTEDQRLEEVKREEKLKLTLEEKYKLLGPMSFAEVAVDMLLIIAVLLWFFRDPKFMAGWGQWFDGVTVGDATIAILISILLFVIPKDPSFLFGKKPKISGTLLDWKFTQARFPSGILLLIGGGFAISNAANQSHLTDWIGQQIGELNSLDEPVILIIVMVTATFITEMLSNTACINVIVPILMNVARNLGFHPLYLALPTAVSCNFAFMFPSSSPVSAIVYAAGGDDIRIIDMVQTGVFVNFLCIAVLYILHLTYGNLLFGFDNFMYANATTGASTVLSS